MSMQQYSQDPIMNLVNRINHKLQNFTSPPKISTTSFSPINNSYATFQASQYRNQQNDFPIKPNRSNISQTSWADRTIVMHKEQGISSWKNIDQEQNSVNLNEENNRLKNILLALQKKVEQLDHDLSGQLKAKTKIQSRIMKKSREKQTSVNKHLKRIKSQSKFSALFEQPKKDQKVETTKSTNKRDSFSNGKGSVHKNSAVLKKNKSLRDLGSSSKYSVGSSEYLQPMSRNPKNMESKYLKKVGQQLHKKNKEIPINPQKTHKRHKFKQSTKKQTQPVWKAKNQKVK